MTTQLKQKVEQVTKRVAQFETLAKNYTNTNVELLKFYEDTWLQMHSERTKMMLAKEEYFN